LQVHEQQHSAQGKSGGNDQHDRALAEEAFRVLYRAVFLEGQAHVEGHGIGHQRRGEDQFKAVAGNEVSGHQREQGDVVEDADDQPLLRVVAQGFTVLGRPDRVVDLAVFREAFGGHQKRAKHPVGDEHGQGRGIAHARGIPAQGQTDGIVHGLAEHVQIGHVLASQWRRVVEHAHDPEQQPADPEKRVQGKGQHQAGDA